MENYGTYLTRNEHIEFKEHIDSEIERLEAEDSRQNKRIEVIERDVRENNKMNANIERLAINMESMQKSIEKQGKRLDALENQDGEKWRKFVGYVASALVGAVIAFLLKSIGLV